MIYGKVFNPPSGVPQKPPSTYLKNFNQRRPRYFDDTGKKSFSHLEQRIQKSKKLRKWGGGVHPPYKSFSY